MKAGSKVVCINDSYFKQHYGGYHFPIAGEIYTVRSVIEIDNSLHFEELANKACMCDNGMGLFLHMEPSFGFQFFREIDATPEMSEITAEQLIEELELTPQPA